MRTSRASWGWVFSMRCWRARWVARFVRYVDGSRVTRFGTLRACRSDEALDFVDLAAALFAAAALTLMGVIFPIFTLILGFYFGSTREAKPTAT